MKLMTRDEFLEMPKGTVYCSYQSLGQIDEICIKHSSKSEIPNDWLYSCLVGVEGSDSEEIFSQWSKIERHQEVKNSPIEVCRNGLFDRDELFLVLDRSDIEGIKEALG